MKTATTRHRDPEGTREALLQAAFEEIHRSGFRSAGLEAILESAGVTKGALYHHFGSKNGLGHAVLEEIVRSFVLERFLEPLEAAADPIQGMIDLIGVVNDEATAQEIERGCPLNNLAQEMSAVDEEFRLRLAAIFDEWRARVAASFRKGQESGSVRPDADPEGIASFIIAVWEGTIGLAKTSRDPEVLAGCAEGLLGYLNTLRPLSA
jgi:AcrR family transcriptional regulator